MDLSKEATEIYEAIKDEYGIDDRGGLLLLKQAFECYDEMRKAQKAIEKNGITFTDRFGQTKPNPAQKVVKDSRNQMLKCIKDLNLDIEPLKDGPGRPLKSLIEN
mgnify:CR=1 FL=1